MDKRTERFADLFLDGLDYSPEIAKANEKIRAALEEKAQEQDFEMLVSEYGSLEKLAELAGYTPEEAKTWRSGGRAMDEESLTKELCCQRRRIYLIAILAIAACSELLWTIFNAVRGNVDFWFTLVYTLLLAGGTWLLLRKVRRVETQRGSASYTAKAYAVLCGLSDLYLKRLINSLALFVAGFFLFIAAELSFYFFGNSKAAELAESMSSNAQLIDLPLYLLLINALCLRLVRRRSGIKNGDSLRKHLWIFSLLSLLYWLAVLTATVVLHSPYPANVFLAAGILYLLLVLVYDLTLRKRITQKNLVFNRRRIALVTAAAVLIAAFAFLRHDTWYTQPYINSVPVVRRETCPIDYDEETGVYTLTASDGDFKIMHLTDIHLGNSLYSYRKDIKALEACYQEISYTKPDLVIVTGDLCFPLGIMSMSLNNAAPVYQFAAFMRNTGIPWAFTYGNHDTESIASMNREQLNDVYMSLSFKTSGNLLYPYVQPEITGRNNQLLELRNADGTLNTALFLLDSNAYTGEGINVYDYIHDDQVDWYAAQVERLNAEAGRTVPSMVFFHIPLQQYRTAYELYEAGSDEITYYFGENREKMINKVCCSDYPSSLFDRMLELGSTTGVFCGHDHYNNMSLGYKGIRLTYGMSIDYLAMPGIENDTAQRGAELITVHPDASWDLEQIPLTSIT